MAAALPDLPFADGEFNLTLCSHFLFLYSGHLSEEFHVRSIVELCRVAREARVFPLLELGAVKSRHLDSILARLASEGLSAQVERRAVRIPARRRPHAQASAGNEQGRKRLPPALSKRCGGSGRGR